MPRPGNLSLPDPFGEGVGQWTLWSADNARRGGLVLLGPEAAAAGFAEAGYEVWQVPVPEGPVDTDRAHGILTDLLASMEAPRFLVGHGAAGEVAWALARTGCGLSAAALYGTFLPDTDPPALPLILHVEDLGLEAQIEALQTRHPDLRIHRLSAGPDLARLRTLAAFSRATGRGEGA